MIAHTIFPEWHRVATGLLLLILPWSALGAEAERIARDGPDEVRAEVTIQAPVARVLRALEEPCQLRQWTPQLERLKVLDNSEPDQTLVYIATDVGWPFSSRDGITLFSRQEGSPVVLEMQSRPEARPPVEGYVRIPFSEGRWTLTEEGEGVTRVEYVQRVKAGGKVPQWMSDRAGPGQAKELLRALQRHTTAPSPGQGSRNAAADCRGNSPQ